MMQPGASIKYGFLTAVIFGSLFLGASMYIKSRPLPFKEEVASSELPLVTFETESPEEAVPKPSRSEPIVPFQEVSGTIEMLELERPLEPKSAELKSPQSGQLDFAVPFSSQAPLFNWQDGRQQDGCEEAAALMAMLWVKGEAGGSPAEWEEQITGLADFQQAKYEEHRDVSVEDVISRIFNDYFAYQKVRAKEIREAGDILAELEQGNLVLAPANGQALQNPHFTPPGPAHHFLVIKGYDYDRAEFITNDPGTRLGAGYRYAEETLIAALRAYPTGYHGQYETERKTAIVVEK